MAKRHQQHALRRSPRGQAMAEFAMILPIAALLMFGLFLAGLYVWRAVQVDYGLFLSGVATGAYRAPATDRALSMIPNPEIRSAIQAGAVSPHAVRSRIEVDRVRLTVLGVEFREVQRGQTFFWLWRFRPGPQRGR